MGGVDGRNYAGFGLLPSVVAVPAFATGWVGGLVLHKETDLTATMAVALFNCLLTPLVCVFIAIIILRLGYSRRAAVLASLIIGLASPFGYYGSKGFYSEPHLSLGFLACWYLILSGQRVRDHFLAGISLGFAYCSRPIGVVLLPVFAYYFARVQQRRARTGKALSGATAFLCGNGICLAGIAWSNFVRFGSVFKTGYHLAFPSLSALFSTPFSMASQV